MNTKHFSVDVNRWIKPLDPDEMPEQGYDEAVQAEIATAEAEIAAGKGITAEQVWKKLGIE